MIVISLKFLMDIINQLGLKIWIQFIHFMKFLILLSTIKKLKGIIFRVPSGENRYFDNTKELRTALGSFIHC